MENFPNVADVTLYLLVIKFVTFVKRLKKACRNTSNMSLL